MKTFKQFCEDTMSIGAPAPSTMMPANNTQNVPIPKEPVISKKKQNDYTKKQFLTNLNTGRKIKSTF